MSASTRSSEQQSGEFIDYTAQEFDRHEEAQGRRGKLALLRNALAESGEPARVASVSPAGDASQVEDRLIEFGHTTASANFLLADVELPPPLRAFIDALIGVAGRRKDEWFTASDKVIAEHGGRSTKWVQINRDDLRQWMLHNRITLVEVEDNYMDGDGEKHPHRYRVHIARFAVESTVEAELSPRFEQNPGLALQEAARALRDSLPTMPPRRKRRRLRETDAETIINRKLTHIANELQKVLALRQLSGNRAGVNWEKVAEIATLQEELMAQSDDFHHLRERVVEKSSTTPPHAEEPELDPVELAEMEAIRAEACLCTTRAPSPPMRDHREPPDG